MKLRFRIESRGWYIPQYYSVADEIWKDFTVALLGTKTSEIHKLAMVLGKPTRWDNNIYHFEPTTREQKKEDMSLIFETEILVSAFLGAARVYYGDRTKEFYNENK